MDFFGLIGIPLGWIMWAIDSLIHNYGWSLIIFVILTRVLLFPLSIKQQKNTAKMALISQKMKQIQKQFSKDKTRLQQEQMKLYEDAGVNPMAGCLPMLLQMFLLFGIVDVIYKPLTHVLRLSAETLTTLQATLANLNVSSSTFQLTVIDAIQNPAANEKVAAALTNVLNPDQISQIKDFNINFLGINLGLVPNQVWGFLILIPIIAFATQILYTLIMMKIQKQNGQDMQGMMKWTMLLMPILSLFMAFTMPAGIGIYWTVSNLLMIGQSVLLQKMYPPDKMVDPNSKDVIKAKAKMQKKRERMEVLNKRMEERGVAMPNAVQTAANAKNNEPETAEEKAQKETEKEINKRRLAEARRKMAEKYGDDITND